MTDSTSHSTGLKPVNSALNLIQHFPQIPDFYRRKLHSVTLRVFTGHAALCDFVFLIVFAPCNLKFTMIAFFFGVFMYHGSFPNDPI